MDFLGVSSAVAALEVAKRGLPVPQVGAARALFCVCALRTRNVSWERSRSVSLQDAAKRSRRKVKESYGFAYQEVG